MGGGIGRPEVEPKPARFTVAAGPAPPPPAAKSPPAKSVNAPPVAEDGEGIWLTIDDPDAEAGDNAAGERLVASAQHKAPIAGLPCPNGNVSRLVASLPTGVGVAPEVPSTRAGVALDASSTLAAPVTHIAKAAEAGTRMLRVSIQRQGAADGLGAMVVKSSSDDVVLTRVRDGAINRWNQEHPDSALLPGDSFVEVNGVRGTFDEKVVALKSSLSLEILVSRPLQPAAYDLGTAEGGVFTNPYGEIRFQISVRKDGMLGIEIDAVLNGALKVICIKEGPVQVWNATAPASHVVVPGDIIEAVNGVTAGTQVLLALIRSNDELVLRFVRRSQASNGGG